MRLVEAVAGKLLDHAKQFGRLRFAEAVFECPRQKLAAVLGDGLQLFLADRLDALIRLRQVNPAESVQNPHHLFLVDHHAVGLIHDRIDDRMDPWQRLLPVLDLHVGHDHAPFERAGSVEGRGGDDVGEFVGLHLGQQVAHPARLKLEDAFGFATLKQCKRGLVVERQLDRIDLDPAMLSHILHGLVENREVPQPEKVHLEQTGLLDRRAFPLRDDVGLAGDRLQRDVLGNRTVGNHDARRVSTGTAREALDLLGEVQDLADLRVRVVQFLQLGAFLDRFVERDVQRFGHHLGDDIDILRRDGEDSRDIADRRLGLQRAERSDLRDVGRAVLLLRVVDHQLTAIAAEVDVDIGRLRPAGVEEPLEQQVVLQRTNVTQLEHVGDDRAARRTSGTARNPLLTGEPHEVPHDQEVADVTHLLDDAQLEVQPVAMCIGDAVLAVAELHPLFAQLAQVVDVLLACGRLKDRVVPRFQIELDIDTVGDLLRPRNGMLEAGKDGVHLGGRADEELVGIHLHPLGVGSLDLRVDAQQHVVHRGIGLVEVVRVVRRHQRQAHPVREIHRHVHALFLDVEAGVLNLHVEAVAEDLRVPRDQLLGLFLLPAEQQLRQFARRAAGQQNQSLAVRFEQFLVDARPVVEALQKRGRRQFDEVLKPDAVHGEQRQVVAGLLHARRARLVEPRAGSDVGFEAQYRIDARATALVVKIECSVQIAVIGDGEGIHPRPLHLFHDLIDPVRTVEQAVVRVTVQVSKRAGRSGNGRGNGFGSRERIGHGHPFRELMQGIDGTAGIVSLARRDSINGCLFQRGPVQREGQPTASR